MVFSNSPQSYEILCPDPHMRKDSLIFVTGHQGLVGSALVRRLRASGYTNLIFQPRDQLDLRDAPAVDRFFASQRPEYVFMAAAKVGGILANGTYPVDFLRDNLLVQLSVMEAAYRQGARKLAFL